MKIVQIIGNRVHWDATPVHPTWESLDGKYAPNIIFVQAPDYVFEGWGFDWTKTGNDRFVMPEVPEGFEYDPATGTFYDPNDINGEGVPIDDN